MSRRAPRTRADEDNILPASQLPPPDAPNYYAQHEASAPSLSLNIVPWLGPVSFVLTVAISIWFIPALRAFILGIAVAVVVEAALAAYKATWWRPSTIIRPAADVAHSVFDRIGQGLAAAFDVAWWLDELWTFLRRVLPLDRLWEATIMLLAALFRLVTVPISAIVGFIKGIIESSNPIVSLIVLALVAGLTAFSIGWRMAPWDVIFAMLALIRK